MSLLGRPLRATACAVLLVATCWAIPGAAQDEPAASATSEPSGAADTAAPDESAEALDAAAAADAQSEAQSEAANRAAAEAAGAAQTAAEAAGKTPTGPPVPPFLYEPDRKLKWDWMQINTGEWLKGEIKDLHRKTFEFDSDKFDEVDVDWMDVVILVSKDVVTIRVENASAVTGRIDMRNKVARMHTADGVVEVPQHQILGMIPGTLSEWNYWSGGASIGLSARGGNTEQMDVTLGAGLTRQTELTRWRTSYTGQFSTVDRAETANNHRVPSQFDIYLTRRFFLTTPIFEYYTDPFQNLGTRITIGSGVGYELLDLSWLYVELNGGLGYQYTDYLSVEAGDEEVDNDAAIYSKTIVNFDLPYGFEWNNSYTLQLIFTDLGKTSHHVESEFSFDLWGPLDFEVTFVFDRIEKPVPNSDGTRPQPNDYRLTAGIGIDF